MVVVRVPHRRRIWSLHVVVVLQRTAKKCTKIYNARAHLLFFLFNLLFVDVLVAVVVLVCLSFLAIFPVQYNPALQQQL